jgi:hypothetical protein
MSPGRTVFLLAIPAGLEPATLCLEVRRELSKPTELLEKVIGFSQLLPGFVKMCPLAELQGRKRRDQAAPLGAARRDTEFPYRFEKSAGQIRKKYLSYRQGRQRWEHDGQIIRAH